MPFISGISMSSNIRSKGFVEHQFERLSSVGRLGDVAKTEGVERTNQREPHGAAVVHDQHGGLVQRVAARGADGLVSSAEPGGGRIGIWSWSWFIGLLRAESTG